MAVQRRKGRVASRGGVAEQFGFLGEGVLLVLGWLGQLVAGIWSLLAWTGKRVWASIEGEKGRTPYGMALAAASLFTFVALFDYRANLPASENLCGQVGHDLAGVMLWLLGWSAFLPPAFGAFWGCARIFRENSGGNPGVKLLGVIILSAAVSVLSQWFAPAAGPSAAFPTGTGGVLGAAAVPPLVQAFGSVGTGILVSLLVGIALLLATEWGFVPLVRELIGRSSRQQALPLEARKGSLRDQANSDRKKAQGFLSGVGEIMKPFHPGEESDGAQATDQIPVNIPGAEEKRKPAKGPIPKKEKAGEAEGESGSLKGFELPGISDAPQVEEVVVDSDEDEAPAPPRRRPRLDSLPPVDILSVGEKVDVSSMRAEVDALGKRLQKVFDDFGLNAQVVGAERGPTLTLFEVQLGTGVSVKKLQSQKDDLGVALGSHGVRVVFPLPGRTTVGVEVPNIKREAVRLREVYEEAEISWEENKLPMVLGRDTLGRLAVEDLTAMPHMLIAGTTGSGKSVCLNSVLATLLLSRTPDQLRLVLVDPKQVELQLFQDIPHLLCPVVTDMKRAPFVLDWSIRQMEDRLHLFKKVGVRDIKAYNDLGEAEIKNRAGEEWDPEDYPHDLPYFVLVIDELADMMMVSAKEVETSVARLAAKARAAGVHIMVATQRPSTDVVTGLIKTNLPVRMAFRVTASVDSRVILDEGGAESLLGNGDFLYRPPGSGSLVRGQGAFVSEREVREICEHLREHGKPEFLEELVQMRGPSAAQGAVDDPLYEEAVRVVLQSGRGSASLLQRALSVGYTRASRLIDIMTEQGVLGPFIGSKAREVLVTLEEWEAQQKQPQ
ncbi:MAG TPA: hypothetical protein DDW23_02075 [Planctomycetes bacterium]|nr:hypothetical protein [Planctomycetota bacterium]